MAHEAIPRSVAGKELIQQKMLRQKLGNVSAMFLFRHKNELPVPVLIGGRRFWLADEVEVYIERLAAERNRGTIEHPGCTP